MTTRRHVLPMALLGLAGCALTGPARRADRHLARHEFVAAIWEYGNAIDRGNSDPDVAWHRACTLRIMGDEREAERDLVRAARAGSIEAKALLMAARGVSDLSIPRQLIDRYPDAEWAWALYGDCLMRAQRPDDAAMAYERSLAIDPRGDIAQSVRYNLVLALLRQGRLEEATSQLNSYLTYLDGQPGADERLLAGILAYGRGDWAGARAAWRGLPSAVRAALRHTVGDEDAFSEL